jgi:hypothetical protein
MRMNVDRMQSAKVFMLGLYDEAAKLQAEQDRAEQEKQRTGMPGAIRRSDYLGTYWTRKRYDVQDNNLALFRSPELD